MVLGCCLCAFAVLLAYTASKVNKKFRGRVNSMLGGQQRACRILGTTLGEKRPNFTLIICV